MTKPELVRIPVETVSQVWPLIDDLVDFGVKRTNGRLTAENLKEYAEDGRYRLFVIWQEGKVKAVIMAEIYITLSGRKIASVTFVAGRRRHEWIELIQALEGWARSEGADVLEAWARKGWQRDLPDYRMTHVLLEKELNA